MLRRIAVVASLAAVGLISMSAVGTAGKFNKVIDVGAAAPDWAGIAATDDKTYGLADFKDKKLVVVVFTCNHCPVAVACEDRIIELQKDYGPQGVQVVAINVNNLDEDKMDKMKERAKEKGFNFPYLYDPTQQVARDYGAAVTPHFFVLDGNRKVAYMGAMDDQPLDPASVAKPYLRQALDALLAGQTVPTTETKQQGCSIRYE